MSVNRRREAHACWLTKKDCELRIPRSSALSSSPCSLHTLLATKCYFWYPGVRRHSFAELSNTPPHEEPTVLRRRKVLRCMCELYLSLRPACRPQKSSPPRSLIFCFEGTIDKWGARTTTTTTTPCPWRARTPTARRVTGLLRCKK